MLNTEGETSYVRTMTLRCLLALLFVVGCGDDDISMDAGSDAAVDSRVDTRDSATPDSGPDSTTADALLPMDSGPRLDVGPEPVPMSVRSYMFGHSLLVHSPPLLPTAPDETTVPHWLHDMATESGHTFSADGQYGFLMQHADLPPRAQWGFAEVPSSWDEEGGESFADADFTTVLLTAANFIQYQPPTVPFDGDNPRRATPVSETVRIVDWVSEQEPDAAIFIYENWPDMAGFLGDGFPPSDAELERYDAYVRSDFHAWWIAYQDAVRSERPSRNVHLIPVGPILAELRAETPLGEISATDLYEDDAPHGRPTLYFLASMISFMAIFGDRDTRNLAMSYRPADSVHRLVHSHWDEVVLFIHERLRSYDGSEQRVWPE